MKTIENDVDKEINKLRFKIKLLLSIGSIGGILIAITFFKAHLIIGGALGIGYTIGCMIAFYDFIYIKKQFKNLNK